MHPTAFSRAISDSLKGGWNKFASLDKALEYAQMDEAKSHIFFDKAFWVALGVARKWPKGTYPYRMNVGLIESIWKDKTPEQFFLSLEVNEV